MSENGSIQGIGVGVGDIIAGKYRIEYVLGVGGMGVVVAAYHMQLEERVAIKFLLPSALDNPEIVGRFKREARAAVKIKSEHVARVIDVGNLDNGAPYLVMEFLDGLDLDCWLQQRGALPIEQAVEFVLQACEAIAEAHVLGIVHRDLKPANMYCVRRPDGVFSIKVLDFGISKVSGERISLGGLGATKTSAIVGSPLYMSPEQLRSARAVDTRTDIWSLGTILYQLLAARPPFWGETLPDLCLCIVTSPTPLIRASRPEVSVELERVICKCLEKEREQRFLNVAELAVALVSFGPKRARSLVERITGIIQSAGMSASAVALPPSSDSTVQSQVEQTVATWGQTTPPRGWPKHWLPVAVTGLAAVLGLSTYAWHVVRVERSSPRMVATQHAAIESGQLSPTESTILPVASAPTEKQTGVIVSLASDLDIGHSHDGSKLSSAGGAKAVLGGSTKQGSGSKTGPTNAVTAATKANPAGPPTNPKCDPPYDVDAEGRKHFRPECY